MTAFDEFTVAGLSRPAQPWTLRIFPQGIHLTPERGGHPPIHLLRSEIATHVQLLNFGLTPRTLVVRKPVKRNFKLDQTAWPALTAWVGRDARLRMALRQRFGLGIWVGAILMLASIPLGGDPAAGIPPKPFDLQAAALGALLIGGTLVSRRRPHPLMFLADSLWFVGIAMMIAIQVLNGRNPLWLMVVASQLLFVWNGVSLYRDFAAARP
jgi:hypothetical protein